MCGVGFKPRGTLSGAVLTYDDLVEFARLCWRQAHLTQNPEVARHLT
jgi:hypothetical protein